MSQARTALVPAATLALLLAGCALTPTADAPRGDAEPPDPAEYREPVLPPARPEGIARSGDAVLTAWVERGPAPTRDAQVNVPPNDEVCGAIQALAPHPSNANVLYIGAVNGGVWRTNDALAASPSWVPLTDALPSQSIGAVAFDPTDASHQTLVAGTGRWSNFAQRGDDQVGVYRTVNGGVSWTQLGASPLLDRKLVAVLPRGATILAAARSQGLYRSIDTGATWPLASGSGGLPTGGIGDLASHRDAPAGIYVSVLGATPKVLRSDNTGASWNDVTTGIGGLSASTGNIRLAVGPGAAGVVFAAVVNGGSLAGVYRSPDQGATWQSMDVPTIHPGGQGTSNTSIAADPANSNLVYLGGDRISGPPYTGNLVRGNASLGAGTQFTTLMDANGGNTAPHADSRNLAFDANGNLLEVDDGCVYRRSSPTSTAGSWTSVAGNLNVIEVHDLDHDGVANILLIGTQDNGTHMQQTSAGSVWTAVYGGDGGDVAVEDSGSNGLRFMASQNLGGFRRNAYNAANGYVSGTSISTAVVTDAQFVTPTELNRVDPTRMLVAGTGTLYESTNANGAGPTLVSIGGPGANRSAIAYGANGDAAAAYVGKGGQVHRRVGAAFVPTTTQPAAAATLTDLALDPDDAARVFAIDDNQVFYSSDSGGIWTEVTGNLPSIASRDFRTIEFIPGTPDRVALGTRSGVYFADAGSSVWSLAGSALPDVLVFDLRYVAAQQTLYAGTLGRGVWSLNLAAAADAIFSDSFGP
ncbi:MAG: hypothetical protein IPG63_19180 [Xanthomonadales bacterium]|nr:hypothetical protein [Xanthomonadales bacterium]